MAGISTLRAELDRWQKDLTALQYDYTADGWSEPEKLMFILQRTASTYRRQVLPRIAADRELMLPALPDGEVPAALAAYSTIVADELSRLVDQLEELRRDLVRSGQTAQIQLRATEVLAATSALGTVVLRFVQEVELPSLSARLSPEQADQLAAAVHAYEKSIQ
jgi:Mg2+ and Co2+ transporter CorA